MTIITFDLTKVIYLPIQIISVFIFLFLLIWLARLGCIDSNTCSGTFLLSVLFTLVLFLLFLSFELEIPGFFFSEKRIFRGFGLAFFAIFITKLFDQPSVHKLVALVLALIHITASRKLNSGFDLGFYHLFYQDITTILFPAFFINP